jgi:hypothetical protein
MHKKKQRQEHNDILIKKATIPFRNKIDLENFHYLKVISWFLWLCRRGVTRLKVVVITSKEIYLIISLHKICHHRKCLYEMKKLNENVKQQQKMFL